MPDGFSIATFLGGVKTAKETLSLIINSKGTLERTEFEYKIASLTKTLTELENQVRGFESIIQEKDKKIKELEDLLTLKTKVSRGKHGLYYKESDREDNQPICPYCWESCQKIFHLGKLNTPYFPQYFSMICQNCDKTYRIPYKEKD